MKWHRIASVAAAAALAVLLMAPQSQAAFGNFNYATSVAAQSGAAPPAPPSDPPGGPTSAVVDIGNGNSISFTGNADTSAAGIDATLPGGADINFASVVFNPATDNGTATPYTVSFDVRVSFTDVAGGDTQFADFTGTITGTASGSDGTTGAAINSTVFSFAVAPSSLGFTGGTYDLLAKNATGPGSSGGSIVDGKLQGNVAAVPEPASATLLGLGSLGLLAALRRRRAA